MKYLLSRMASSHFRTVIYMLQATRYNIGDFLKWYFTIPNLRHASKRGNLKPSVKARLLLGLLYSIEIGTILGLWWLTGDSIFLFGLVLGFIVAPFVGALLITIPLILGDVFITYPTEKLMVARAKRIFAKHPATIIAIAGSYGKTTMKDSLKTVLSTALKVAATPGNMNTPIGISRFAHSLNGTEEVLIVELGESRPGDIKKFCQFIRPDIGVITGVSEAHLKNFGSLEAIADNIFTLADFVDSNSLYFNYDDENLETEARKRGLEGHTYSHVGIDSHKISSLKSDLKGTRFILSIHGEDLDLNSQLLGVHQAGPLSAIVAIAHMFDMEKDDISYGVAQIRPFAGRLEPQHRGHNITVLNDSYNGNPLGVRAAISFLKSLEGVGRKIYVTPGLVDLGDATENIHVEIGKQLASGIDLVVLMKNSVTNYIIRGLSTADFDGELKIIDEPLLFYQSLDHFTKAGDIVMLQNDWPDNYR